MYSLRVIVFTLALLAITAGSQGAIIMADSFEYDATGPLDGKGSAGGGWGGAWSASDVTGLDATVVAGGLNYSAGGITVNGGARSVELQDTNGIAQKMTRSFASAMDMTGAGFEVYFRFLVSSNTSGLGNQDSATTGMNGYRNTPGTSAGSANMAGIYGGGSTAAGEHVAHAASSTSYAPRVVGGGNAVAGQVYLIVGRFWLDPANPSTTTMANRLDIWIDPDTSDTLSSFDISSARTSASASKTHLDGLYLNAWAQLDGGEVVTYDEYIVAENWADVIPEPATLSLLAIGAIGLIRRRR